MEKELPKIDIPENWVAGELVGKELLNLYKNFPIRLKCEMLVLCTEGEVDAMINLNQIMVRANDLIALLPGTIFQINEVKENLKVYFLGFSSEYIEKNNLSGALLNALCLTLGRPIIHLKPEGCQMTAAYIQFVIHLYEQTNDYIKREISENLYADVHKAISLAYPNHSEKTNLSKGEQLSKTFSQLVMRYYRENRNVAWYAEKLGITQAYLCATIKQVTGKTCADIISSMVIMDAQSQLKLTKLSIQGISDSLNFSNISFFGKYFKRNVGMSPQEYRNKG